MARVALRAGLCVRMTVALAGLDGALGTGTDHDSARRAVVVNDVAGSSTALAGSLPIA